MEAGEGLEFFHGGHAAHHVLEAGFIGFVVGNVLDRRGAAGAFFHPSRESLDSDFLSVANIDDFADGTVGVHKADETFYGVAHVAEAAGLLAIAVDTDRGVVQRGLDEIRKNHSIASGLPGAHSIKQTGHNDGELFFLPVGEGEKLIEGFGGGVAPAAFGGGAEDEIGVLMEWNVGVFSVDFGGGGSENEFPFLASGFQDQLRSVDIGFDGLDRALDNEFDADGGSQMDDELRNQLTILDVVEVIFHAFGGFQMTDVVHAAGGKIVEQHNAIAAIEQSFRKMRTDEASAASNQIPQWVSLQCL